MTKTIWSFLKGKRMKSFYWRTGAMFLTALTASIVDSGITGTWVVLLGLMMGEVTKSINSYISENKL
jgi:hypothetical protein